MAKRFPDEGKKRIIDIITGNAAAENLEIRLYTSNTVPADTDTAATYTEMGAVQGYVKKTLTSGAAFSAAAMNGSYAEGVVAATQTFTFTAGGPTTIYGYIVVGATSGVLYYVQPFATPRVVEFLNDAINLDPTFGFDDEVV